MFDDNASPDAAFRWATGLVRRAKSDLQCNHIYSGTARHPDAFSDIRNICYTPQFVAKLTDSQQRSVSEDHLTHILRYRVWALHGYVGAPGATTPPKKPTAYDSLVWADTVGQGRTPTVVKKEFVEQLVNKPKDRLAKSVNRLGWTFSDYAPDASVAYTGS